MTEQNTCSRCGANIGPTIATPDGLSIPVLCERCTLTTPVPPKGDGPAEPVSEPGYQPVSKPD
jgi:hypothetical protein